MNRKHIPMFSLLILFTISIVPAAVLADVSLDYTASIPSGEYVTYTIENNEWVSYTVSVSSGSDVSAYLFPSGDLANYENKDIVPGTVFSPVAEDGPSSSISRSKVTISTDVVYLLLIENAGSGSASTATKVTTPGGPGGAAGFPMIPIVLAVVVVAGAVFLTRRRF